MSESRRYGLAAQLDIEQILQEAQHRWLRPAEICEILRNYTKFRIAPEPPHIPPSGSLFLFDRKVLRYFRKDGHSWRKKKDGKTVKEAHERLKAGSVDVLHCYYAHGEENQNFQRRSYWLLEEEHSNIVLVHYREVKGTRANLNLVKEVAEAVPNSQYNEFVPNSEVETSVSSKLNPYSYQVTSQTTDTGSLMSSHASEYEDAESAYNHPSNAGFHSFLESQSRVIEKTDGGLSGSYYPMPVSNDYRGKMAASPAMDFLPLAQGNNEQGACVSSTHEPQKSFNFSPWEDDLQNNDSGFQSVPFQQTFISNQPDSMRFSSGKEDELLGQALADGFVRKTDAGIYLDQTNEWQAMTSRQQMSETGPSLTSVWSMEQKLYQDSTYPMTSGALEGVDSVDLLNLTGPFHGNHAAHNKKYTESDRQVSFTYTEEGSAPKPESGGNLIADGKSGNSPLRQPLIGGLMKEGLKKLDSFDRWVSKELEDVNEPHIQHTSVSYWDEVDAEDGAAFSGMAPQERLDTYMLSPSLSQDQLFSIIDFSPNWAYAGSEIKVLITGKFLKSSQDVEKCNWSCMFGEVEVPAEIIADGVLRCHTPSHKPGRVPFYVTCSNRLACSEVREFDYRVDNVQDVDIPDIYCGSTDEVILRMRFAKLLCPESSPPITSIPSDQVKNSLLISKISLLLKDDDSEWGELLKLTSEEEFYPERVKDHLLQKLLKEKLHTWLLQKLAEGGKGASVLDEEGQGVLHFAAALGYDWAIPPTLVAGVSVNFRDVNGWTALHWAASCGREQTVGFLISRGAFPGALTDPTPLYHSGRTPADLASAKGHKGIAGFLAESSLSDHLSALQVKDGNTNERDGGESTTTNVVQRVTERTATPVSDGDLPHGLSLKDSLAAVCNATQAAARIHQVYRAKSFQRKQLKEYGDKKIGMSDERALSLVAVKSRLGPHDEPVQTAAIRIQNKFRSYKGRKEYLTIRQHIVKIQAHVRGHQVRKSYRKIIWSVGILDKVILRWRRKGRGLSGFKQEAIAQSSSQQHDTSSKDDDDDFLKEGRKRTEERLQKALERVKSMVQYPEARDQYRRLLNVVTDMKENKDMYDKVLNNTEEAADFDDDLIDIEALLGDDTYMTTAS